MRSSLLWGCLSGLGLAQLLDIDAIKAAPPVLVTPLLDVPYQSATYAPAPTLVVRAANDAPRRRDRIVRFAKRDGTCAQRPSGGGYVPNPDTDVAFVEDPSLNALATNAPTPAGYSQVFSDLQASVTASNYMGLWTLSSYDTITCASLCDQNSGCVAFNTYLERDPALDPNAVNCPNPASTTFFRCTLWGAPISASEATNAGQYQDSFHVVITGSNGYTKDAPPAAIAGFSGPVELGGAIDDSVGTSPYASNTGSQYYYFSQTQGYTPSTCAQLCLSLNTNSCGAPVCTFFNAFVVSENGFPQGLYCNLYNQTFGPAQATNYGSQAGLDRFSISESYSYTLTTLPVCNLVPDPTFANGVNQAGSSWTASVSTGTVTFTTVANCLQGSTCFRATLSSENFRNGFTLSSPSFATTSGTNYILKFNYAILGSQYGQCTVQGGYGKAQWGVTEDQGNGAVSVPFAGGGTNSLQFTGSCVEEPSDVSIEFSSFSIAPAS